MLDLLLPLTLSVLRASSSSSSSSSPAAASHGDCSAPLLSDLPQSSFQSSSQFSDSYGASNAKLDLREGGGGWAPLVTDQEPWLQVDLREPTEVTAVATQGCYDSWDWVSRYLLLYSDTGRLWRVYRNQDAVEKLVGNADPETAVQNKLSHPLRTRFLRFVPLDWNPGGWIGLRVQAYGCAYKSHVVSFTGRSSLMYRFSKKSTSTMRDVVSLRFKSHHAEGVLLHGDSQTGDYITLELHRGRLDLYLNLDDKPRFGGRRSAVTVGSLLDDQHWHSVRVERLHRQVNLTVDSHTRRFQAAGEGRSLELDYELSFGGIPLPGKPGTFLGNNFHGCMENLFYNGINVIDLAKRRKPQTHSVGNVSFSCSQPQEAACTFLGSGSFLSLPPPAPPATPGHHGFSAGFRFRTWNRDGLLLLVPLNPRPHALQLHVDHGWLHLSVQGSRPQQAHDSARRRVDDGLWHAVSVHASERQVTLTVDDQPSVALELWEPLEASGRFHFGGCPTTDCEGLTAAFQGCMQLLSINKHPVNLSSVQRRLLGGYNQLQFDMCNMKDRCLPDRCEHGARCSQTWSSFTCDCSGTGYTGATCHNAIHKSSCEAYKLSGGSSGFYFIDPDGSGPLGPAQVYCNMTDWRVWTVMSHNVTSAVSVQGSSPQKLHSMSFNYSSSAQQLRAIVSGSTWCRQDVSYSCRKSRLFSTKDGSPLSWWLDRDGERRSYWGAFLPEAQQCSCSLEGSCMDTRRGCNCDADVDTWVTDAGTLSYKDHLPVSRMVIGDTHRTGSQASYHVGPLQCYGHQWIWNAASFQQEAAYLSFPPLQAELTCDVSFYFKTGAPSGVFLESRGPQHFIRVELSSPSEVTFSFNVGNGAAFLPVRSPVPLNDRQWHQVRAERNVKEAGLQVDLLPRSSLDAPPDGQLRLQLSSQLFIGGSPSLQRGFLGCIRALLVNGAALDLEERAKATPGVGSGCPGYCSGSSSLCHNRGRCVEDSGGYTCDCSLSAYGGATCSEEVSASFHRDASVTYTFQEPFSVMRNRGLQSSSVSMETRAREDVALSFATSQRPAMLLTASTVSRQYVAVILTTNGSLQVWYHLQADGSPDAFSPPLGDLADGRLHRVRLRRVGRNIHLQVDDDVHAKYTLSSEVELDAVRSLTLGKVASKQTFAGDVVAAAAHGFAGCLSSVHFNHVTPLKAALTNQGGSLVTTRGQLVQSNCEALVEATTHTQDGRGAVNRVKEQRDAAAHNLALLAGVLAVVFIAVCVLAAMSSLLYLRCRDQRRRRREEEEEEEQEQEATHGVYKNYRTELRLHHHPPPADEFYI